MAKLTGLSALKRAKDMKCKIRYKPSRRKPFSVDINCEDHHIHLGEDEGTYFIATHLKGMPLWYKQERDRRKFDALVTRALGGFDIGDYLKKRLK